MRPLRLSVEGLRSFRAPVEIEFMGRGHLAIVGDTGAGKSSILEAITYALYGQTTFSGHGNQELMNDTSTALRVVLRFAVSGETWEVARTLRRAGDGSVTGALASLQRLDDSGTTLEQMEQVRVVNKRITELLGLDADAFLRTVVLPQGRFARLLVDDDPRERAGILRQVWGTEELERAGTQVDTLLTELRPLLARVDQELEGTPPNPSAHLATLRAARDKLKGTATIAAEVLSAAMAAKSKLDTAIDRSAAVDASKASLDDHDPAALLEAAVFLEDAVAAIGKERDALLAKRDELAKDRADVPLDDDGLTGAEVATFRVRLEQIGEQIDQIEEHSAQLGPMRAEAEEKSLTAQVAEDAATAAQHEFSARDEHRVALAEASGDAEDRYRESARLLESAREAGRFAAESATAAAEVGERRTSLAEALVVAEATFETRREAASQAEGKLEEARRHNAAASASASLRPGDPCPVCGEPLAADWEPPASTTLNQAQDAQRHAREASEGERAAVVKLSTSLEQTERRLSGVEEGATIASERSRERTRALSAHIQRAPDECLGANDALVEPIQEAAQQARARLESFETETNTRRESASAAQVRAGVAATEARTANEAVSIAERSVTDALRGVQDSVTALPTGVLLPLDLPETASSDIAIERTALASAAAVLDARDVVLGAREEQRTSLDAAVREADVALKEIEERQQREIGAPARGLLERLQAHRDAMHTATVRLELDVEIPPSAAEPRPDAIAEAASALRNAHAAVIGQLRTEQMQLARDRSDADSELAALAKKIGAPPAESEAIVGAAERAADEARFTARTSAQEEAEFARIADALAALQGLAMELSAKEVALGDVAAALRDGAFPKWLTLRRSRSLLVHASRLLSEMSSGRYAFADPGSEEDRWMILDNDSGLPRSPASLSGGEQFVASLALALGMVEMMGRSGGRIEALFLDEGFGALDRANLDAALEALTQVAATGRMVAIISHIRAVAEQVEHVLAVTREATGTRVHWLDVDERNRLSESESMSAVSGALAGLVD